MVIDGRPEDLVPEEAREAVPAPPLKMVIWDLDETLWEGTLSEGPIFLPQERTDLVRALNRRGIVNSICSKNDEEDARSQLEEAGIWSEFVFARIDWTPKGSRVARIIEDAQLRPPDVLFVDDLALNREEVRHAVPGIRTAAPDILDRLLTLPECAGKDDHALSRLRQYRTLEDKLIDREASTGSNDGFLRSCDIRIGVFTDTSGEEQRLFELVHRTNQLNFTKRRPDWDEFSSMLNDTEYATGYIRVRDRYGDYGICGFYSESRKSSELTDFLFSCRVLHMGVEQWVFDYLGRPSIEVVGDVVSSLDGPSDWITQANEEFISDEVRPTVGAHDGSVVLTQPNRVLMVGGCDLTATEQFLGGDIVTEFSHTGATGAFIFVGHTETLRQSADGITDEETRLVDRIPFLDRGVFASPVVVDPAYEVLVYSTLTDYTQGLYRHRGTGLLVPWHQFVVDVTDPATWSSLEKRFAREGMDRSFFEWFAREFEFLGGISEERFGENIRWLADAIPSDARLILLNGAEVPLESLKEPDRYLHHRRMNAVLDEVVAGLPNVSICDLRTFVLTEDDVMSDIRHYRRHVYLRMAEEIRGAGAPDLVVQPERVGVRVFRAAWRFAGRRKVEIRRWSKRWRRGSRRRSA